MKNVTFGHGGTMAQGIILNAGTAKIDNLTIQDVITAIGVVFITQAQ
ncbi:hypothetical protein CUPS4066_09815 [Campylobacter upsaliensis]|nr:hypothetical protein [Campylobacter upsaliensis]MCR2108991.1 hypothetical protein [Campylobacter upsaliensis]